MAPPHEVKTVLAPPLGVKTLPAPPRGVVSGSCAHQPHLQDPELQPLACPRLAFASLRSRRSMGPAPRTLELFYDVLSPYSWLGFEVLCRYQHLWNVKLHLRPCLISGIMKDSGNKPPALVPRKAQYMASDLRHLNQHFQVPIQKPKDFYYSVLEKGSLSAMRFLTAVNMEQPEMLEKVSRELWMRIWSRDEDITEPQSILAAAEKAGLAAEQAQGLLEKISTTQVKNQLKETTEAACKYGAFGLPVTVAHIDGKAHMLFGCDRLELLAFLLGEKWMGPAPPVVNARL